MERLLVEIGGVSIIFGAVFAVSKLYSISDIDKRLSKDTNQAIFCIIPVAVYALFRLYFKLLFDITSFGKFAVVRPIASRAVIFSGLLGGVYCFTKFVPHAQESLIQLYQQTVGNVPMLVLAAGEGQIKKAKYMGGRIVGLIVGWFAFLFCLELVLRMFLGLVALILNSFRGSVKGREAKIEEQVVEEKAKFPVEIDEIKKVKFDFDMKVGKEL